MEENKQKLDITIVSWVRAAIVVVIAYALYLLSEFILVIIVSVVIASAIEPVITWAKKSNFPRLPMAFLVYIISAIFLVGLFYFLLLPLVGEISNFVRTLNIYFDSVTNGGILSEMFQNQDLFAGFDAPVLIRELSSQLNSLAGSLSQGVFSTAATIFGGIMNFVLILVLSFYLVAQEDGVSKFLKMITPVKHEDYAIRLWRRSQAKIGLWVQGQLLSSSLVMLLVYVSLLVVGIPNALLLAVLAGVFELIPFFGATLAAIPALFVAFTFGGMSTAFIVAIIYIVIQQLDNHIINPLVINKIVGIPPIISIISLVVGGILAGFLGVLIAVPVAAVIIEFVSDFDERKAAQISETQPSS